MKNFYLETKNFKYIFITLFAFMSVWLRAQPTVFYTTSNANSVSGFTITNSRILLVDRGAFRQAIFQNNTANNNKNWAFHIGTTGSADYTKNWRPYQTGSADITIDAITAPNTTNPGTGALYNTSSGGQDGNWTGFSNSTYVIVNTTENASSNNHMAVWQTIYLPNTLSGASHTAGTTTVTLGSALASGENMFVRASTDAFATSTISQVTFSGTTGTFTFPATLCGTVSYYFYTSSQSLSVINSLVTTHGQLAHDMSSFYVINNGGSNYSTSLVGSVGGSIAGGATVCSGTNSTNLTLSGHTGGVTKWQSSTVSDFSSAVTDIVNTTTSLTATNLTATTYYRAVVQNGVCAVANSSTATITVNSPVIPTFNTISPICSGATLSALPTTSINSITGTWSPALNNAATTTYTFTPTAGQCATTTTLTITVNPYPIAYNMTGGGTYCAGGSGVPVGLSNSQSGVSYQLKRDGTDVGSPVSGTGSSLSFGNQTAAGVYTVLATSGTCATLITNNGTTAQVPTSGLVAYYPFSGNANDASNFGNTATTPSGFTQPTLTTDRHGNMNAAYQFNGIKTLLQAVDAPQLRPVNLTMSHWAYINNNSNIRSMVGKSYTSTNCDAYTTFIYGGRFSATSCSAIANGAFPGGNNFLDNTAATTGTWKFVTYVFDDDNNTLKLYIDGALVNSFTSWNNSLVYDNAPFQIGASTEEGSVQFHFDGKLDDIRLYNRVLSNPEIMALYQETPTVVTVYTPASPSVSIVISSGANPTCPNSSVTFTATPTNGGTSPSYQWKKEENDVGTNSPTYMDAGITAGSITCVMTVGTAICTNATTATSTGITLNIYTDCTPRLSAKVFIEGAYNAGTMNGGLRINGKIPTEQPYNTLTFSGSTVYSGGETSTQTIFDNNAIVDWVLVELRNASTPSTVVARRAALLQSDGDIVDTDGTSALAFTGIAIGTYHVVIRHRLCLATRTNTAVALLNGNAVSVNFTNNSNALSGSMKNLGGGVYALYSGDTDRDGDIDAVDLANIRGWNPTPLSYFNYGGKSYDMDFNSEIYSTDILYVKINSGIIQINLN